MGRHSPGRVPGTVAQQNATRVLRPVTDFEKGRALPYVPMEPEYTHSRWSDALYTLGICIGVVLLVIFILVGSSAFPALNS